MPRRIFISVCEESADVHAASLVRAARAAGQDWEFRGLTGPRLRALGVQTVFDFAAHAAMLAGILGLVGRAWRALRAIQADWQQQRPDVVVLLDSPELHLKIARLARRRGIPVLYYVAPQTWASRSYRNAAIVRDVDRLACILPFEEAYFRAALPASAPGGDAPCRAEFVGHPLFEALRRERPVADTLAFLRARAAGRPIVALLPGSRVHVITAMLPRQLEVIRRLRAAGHDVYAAVSCVAAEKKELLRGILAAHGDVRPRTSNAPPTDLEIDLIVDDNASLLTAADLVLVASGTATLHVAHYRKPMIVMYDAGRLLRALYRLVGRWLITTPHLSLVNILAGARVVPEFMPFIRDTAPIAAVAGQLLTDAAWRALMVRQIDEVVRPLEAGDASARVVELIGELLAVGNRKGI
jgi:lipid-A-disaccharide synthase